MTSPADLPEFHAELASIEGPRTDRTTVRLVVVLLGVLAIISTAGVLLLANRQLPVPDALIAIGSATIGALGALLAKTSSAG